MEKTALTQFSDFHGNYLLAGFGRLVNGHLRMGWSGGLYQLTPVWRKHDILTDSQYFILFNQVNAQWELRELKPPFISLTHDRIFCKTGLINEMFLF